MSDYLISTSSHEKVLAIVPKISGSLSMFGSGYIVYDVIRKKKTRQKPLYRILLAMSACDWIVSFWYVMSTWPIPKDSQFVYGAAGTQGSCNAQGFFLQFGIAVPFYNSCLSILYLLMIRYNFSDAKLTKRVEPYMHGFALIFPLTTAAAAIPLELYNNGYMVCWLSEYPIGCGGENNCVRGEYSVTYRRYLFAAPVVLMIFIATFSMGFVYWTVRRQEKRNTRYSSSGSSWALRRTRAVANQGLWFLVPFYITWFPIIVLVLHQKGNDRLTFWVGLCIASFQPCQGFFNLIVYKHRSFTMYAKHRWKRLFRRRIASASRRNLAVAQKDRVATEFVPEGECVISGLGAQQHEQREESPEDPKENMNWNHVEEDYRPDLEAANCPPIT